MVDVFDLVNRHAQKAFWMVETILTDIARSIVWPRDRGYL
jgi:hypothetical protein